MKAIDTNVFVRIFIDDASPEHRAAAVLARSSDCLFVSTVVVIESVWVMSRAFKFVRSQIGQVLTQALEAELFEFEERAVLEAALKRYLSGRADYSDYVLLVVAAWNEVATLLTFDAKLAAEPGAKLLRTAPNKRR
jgi:predicted nucleic-acid-binding protein